MARQYTNTEQIVTDHGEDIAAMREAKATISDISEKYNMTRNTTVMVLGDLGFPAPDWAKDIVENRAIRREKRSKQYIRNA